MPAIETDAGIGLQRDGSIPLETDRMDRTVRR
jgi:hypothetical protein